MAIENTVLSATRQETKDLPIIDPDKDLIGNGQTSETLCQAYAYVQHRAAEDGLVMSYEGNRTKPYPVMLGVCCLHKQAETLLQQRIKTVFSALQKIVVAYHDDAQLQAFLAIPKALNDWVMQDCEPSHRSVDLCRFDMMGHSLDTLRIIEFNANAPGGIAYFGFVNTYWREAPETAELISSWGSAPSILEQPGWFSDWITNLAHRRGLTSIDAIGLLHPPNGNILELPHLQKRLQHQGYQCPMMSPADAYENGKPLFQVAYLKYGVQRTLKDISQWERFCTGVVNNEIVIPSSLSGRWIGDNKLCLAVMSDPRFSYLFNLVEQQAIRQMIPYSRKLGDGINAENILVNKDNWVIKNPYDTRGAGVYVGRDHTEMQWKKLFADQQLDGFLVQEYIDSHNLIAGNAVPGFRDLVAIIASGRIVGYASRVSSGYKVNIAQDGKALSVLSTLNFPAQTDVI